ncbi:serpentine type 7TM GPCR chemoreceptor str domain-containing protein [Ditylenchus destructor]|uniref:Serpentine type 7TM GPCR chemoreceptor str domain-containing protein n=1 Tax=Ditylenchus destructor TaxID=166010 RepID=A0AAD4MKS5_9BILA|nr:serpentine type 7TM GPCR chemoreceptor str domain-containing protein [Ditylenchus destructor]
MNIRRIYHSIENTIGILSLIANVMLLYLILTKSQFRVKVYKTIMLVTCLLDLFYGIFCFIAQPTVFAESGYMIVMADGFFSCRWEFFDHFCCTIYCTFIHLTCIYVVAMFVYRYYIICCQNGEGYIRSITPVFWFAGLYCFMQSTNAFCMYCLGQTPEYRQIGLRVLDHNNWEYDPQMPPYPTVSFATQPKNILHHIIYLSSVTVGYTIIIFFQSSIMRYLGRHGKSEHDWGAAMRRSRWVVLWNKILCCSDSFICGFLREMVHLDRIVKCAQIVLDKHLANSTYVSRI